MPLKLTPPLSFVNVFFVILYFLSIEEFRACHSELFFLTGRIVLYVEKFKSGCGTVLIKQAERYFHLAQNRGKKET